MGEFAAMIAHEINQPLMAAGTYTRLVADALRTPGPHDATASASAEKAAVQVQRAAEVVRKLRALIRLDQSGRAPLAVERILRETLDLFRPELERFGVAVRLALDPDLPLVMADLLQIEQVLLNVLRNAAEAMHGAGDGGGTITIAARRDGDDYIEIELRDTGPGLANGMDGDLQTLHSTKAEGLGIGLPLCRSIVQAHGGTFTIADAPGGGAVVRFTLPTANTRVTHASGADR
jgi:signal transduction histidine kinase